MKGDNCVYRPPVGEVCLISGPNCDNDDGYVFGEYEILWSSDLFVLYGAKDCWPNLDRWEHIFSKPIPPEPREFHVCPSPTTGQYESCSFNELGAFKVRELL